MKEVIKQFFPLILASLCAIFAVQIFFHGFDHSDGGIFTDIGQHFSNYTSQGNLSSVAKDLEAQPTIPFPSIKYVGGTLTTGEAYSFSKLFSISSSEETALYLTDIKNNAKQSVLTEMSSSEIEQLETIPSRAVFDKEQQLLYFHASGIYTLYFLMFYGQEDGIHMECLIPVEVR